jgi:hypothetical protein
MCFVSLDNVSGDTRLDGGQLMMSAHHHRDNHGTDDIEDACLIIFGRLIVVSIFPGTQSPVSGSRFDLHLSKMLTPQHFPGKG